MVVWIQRVGGKRLEFESRSSLNEEEFVEQTLRYL